MGTVYKQLITRPLPTNAERFSRKGVDYVRYSSKGKTKSAKLTTGRDGKERILVESATYYAQFRDHAGVVQEVPTGCRDESAANMKLQEFLREDTLIQRGLLTPTESRLSSERTGKTADHLAAYLQSMRASGRSAVHVSDTDQKVTRLIADCEFHRLKDVNRESMEDWLLTRSGQGMAPRTRNAYLQSIRGFLNWCIETSRLNANPLSKVTKADEKVDRRKQRRAMTETELSHLLRVALMRPLAEYGRQTVMKDNPTGKRSSWEYVPLTFHRLEDCCNRARERLVDNPELVATLELRGRERSLVYKTLVLTGLRCNELRSITVGQVELDTKTPCIELLAADEKNRDGSFIPVRSDLVKELRQWIADVTNTENQSVLLMNQRDAAVESRRLFDVPRGLIKILDRDLLAAGIAKVDSRKRSLDVHALRTTFGTMLSKAGVSPRTAQAAMRHSRIDLTMNVYTDPIALDIAGAVESLPSLSTSFLETAEPMGLRHTGTLGKASGGEPATAGNMGPRTVTPTVTPATVFSSHILSSNGSSLTLSDIQDEGTKNEKTLEITRKTRVFKQRGRRGSNPQPPDRQSGALTN